MKKGQIRTGHGLAWIHRDTKGKILMLSTASAMTAQRYRSPKATKSTLQIEKNKDGTLQGHINGAARTQRWKWQHQWLLSQQNKILQYNEEGKLRDPMETYWVHCSNRDTELNDHQIQHVMTFLLSSFIMWKTSFSKECCTVSSHKTLWEVLKITAKQKASHK